MSEQINTLYKAGTKRNPGKFDCYKAAEPDEPMFVLLGRDSTAGLLVRLWVGIKAELAGRGKSKASNERLVEATLCAFALDEWARKHGKESGRRDRGASSVCRSGQDDQSQSEGAVMDIDLLSKVEVIVCHENSPDSPCPDGTASALLLQDVLPRAAIKFVGHHQPSHDELVCQPGMLFCDICPPEARLQEFIDAGAIVLDHHEKQAHLVERFGSLGVYDGRKGWSGAMLAFAEVWQVLKPLVNPERENAFRFAKLAGIRDTWQKDHPDWDKAGALSEAVRFWPWERWPLHPFAVDYDVFMDMLSIGDVLISRRNKTVKALAESAVYLKTERGLKIAVIGSTETSDVAEAIDADVLVGFKYRMDKKSEGPMMVLSMRSRKGYDVGALCTLLGGGGHKASAGASAQVRGYSANPYTEIRHIFEVADTTDAYLSAKEAKGG